MTTSIILLNKVVAKLPPFKKKKSIVLLCGLDWPQTHDPVVSQVL